jgi:hypothetical protein
VTLQRTVLTAVGKICSERSKPHSAALSALPQPRPHLMECTATGAPALTEPVVLLVGCRRRPDPSHCAAAAAAVVFTTVRPGQLRRVSVISIRLVPRLYCTVLYCTELKCTVLYSPYRTNTTAAATASKWQVLMRTT